MAQRKNRRAGREAYVPLYTVEDALHAADLFVPCVYDKTYHIFPDVSIRFVDAGHLLGSSSIEITVTEDGITKTIVFSGDIGNTDQPLIRDPQYLKKADYVIMESTYGDRSHDKRIDYISQLVPIFQRTFDGAAMWLSFFCCRQNAGTFILHPPDQRAESDPGT